jgi:immune inhibitor A
MNIPDSNQPSQISQPPQPPQPQRQNNFLGLLGIFLVAMACLIMVCVVGSGYLVIRYVFETRNATATPTANDSSLLGNPTPTLSTQTGKFIPANNPTPGINPTTEPKVDLTMAEETLKTLSQAEVPVNDPLGLAHRLQGKPVIPPTLPGQPPVYDIGDTQSFWIMNNDTDAQRQVQSKLACITPHLYFWIQNGVQYSAGSLNKLCDTFENKIYPTDRAFFGSEWTPGVDNDPHLYILFTRGVGRNTAGYFSSADEIPPEASSYSNGHEMFVINADLTELGTPFIYAVLAHEFQHMIHWYGDRNEESWMNEGFSELAAFLNGYGVGSHDFLFASNPDLSLTDWPNAQNSTGPHYGASFLFLDYFLNRFGQKTTQAVVANPANGLVSIDDVLTKENITDTATGQPVTADDVFVDWSLANYLHDATVGDGRFTYTNYAGAPKVKDTETVRSCPTTDQARTVQQYGTDYIHISCRGNFTLTFQGAQEVGVLPVNAHGGNYAFWSNKGDESDMTLTQTFDFTNLQGPISMNYWTWYDLETHYDYLYLVATTDDGNTWQIVKTPSCTEDNITGANYGCGYNGKSKSWIQEKVDLSQFAGQKVTLQFEYITDAAVNGEGLLLDDIEIPQINYKTDFETDNGGWQASGFVRLQNRLPQTFRVTLIKDSQPRSVQYLQVDANQTLSLPLNLTGDITLVVSGTTRFTRQPGNYTFSIQP